MSSVAGVPLLIPRFVITRNPKFHIRTNKRLPVIHCSEPLKVGGSIRSFGRPRFPSITACSNTSVANSAAVSDAGENDVVVYAETFPLKRTKSVEGKIYTRMDHGRKEGQWQLTIGCNLPGKWILHWGVHYIGDVGSEWDQPPRRMRPPGSVAIKDYAIETPLKELKEVDSSSGGECNHEVKIEFNSNGPIAAINFVLKDAETGSWYPHKGRDFKVPLADYLRDGSDFFGARKSFSFWPGALEQLSNMLLRTEDPKPKSIDRSEQAGESLHPNKPLEGFYEEHHVVKEVPLDNSVSVTVRKCPDTAKCYVFLETDLSEDVVIHWGVCKDDKKKWEIPTAPYPRDTEVFKNKALRTKLQPKEDGCGQAEVFTLDENIAGFLFVLKLDKDTWLKCKGHDDFFIPLSTPTCLPNQSGVYQSDNRGLKKSTEGQSECGDMPKTTQEVKQEGPCTDYSDGIINEIRNLVTDISSEKMWKTKSKEAQETILQEIEKLAAEAYSIFRSSIPSYSEETFSEPEEMKPSVMISSGTGSGYEILCQGFNWESHKSSRWYMELSEKAAELSSLGFTAIWLPPPTESVSPEGYMPKDLYNLNSRYGTVDELKAVVNKFHQVGMKVLGDAVLNHRCAHYQNQNGIWNIFGGRLNWDDRAVVADDPHFQGRGNKSSGDNFHAAPNIDHSQDFVRKDLKEWLCWLRKDIGYDGWRLDFVRGFWGGYVKDYIDASEPYFAVGEYWDSLSYTYNEMDYNQDAHRQRIIDWINATGGTAGAFDVTTKGVLHSALERCEYWRLSDKSGKPPGVVGWWPSRAVTFLENHDTGSTQGHWRFPGGKEIQGYAYILTHPGTPTVFYDHIFSHYNSEIAALISLRNRNRLHCRSTVKITKAERDVYAAIIDDKVAMKIGPGHYEPPNSQSWSLAIEGNSFKVWDKS